MLNVKYPEKKPSLSVREGVEKIFCVSRKKWVVLTPEEWVRQNFMLYLSEMLNYPISLMAVEKQVKIGELKKRFDIVVFKDSSPFILIECKEMNVPLTASVLHQVLNYNIGVQSHYLVVTNGNQSFAFEKSENNFIEAHELQRFS